MIISRLLHCNLGILTSLNRHVKAVYSLENNLPRAIVRKYLFPVDCHSPIVI